MGAHGSDSDLRYTRRTREYWMIYRGPGFLAVLWFGSSPTPSLPPIPSVSLTGETLEDRERETTWWRERRGGGSGAKKARTWSSLIHSILSAQYVLMYALSSAYRKRLKKTNEGRRKYGSPAVRLVRLAHAYFGTGCKKSYFQVCKQKRN